MTVGHGRHESEVVREHSNHVEGQAAAGDEVQARLDVGTHQPQRIGFVVDQVSDPAEGRVRSGIERRFGSADIGQRDPADDGAHEPVAVGNVQDRVRVREAAGRLDEDRAVDARRGELGFEIARRVGPVDRAIGRRRPRVPAAVDVPEVLVCVDPDAASHPRPLPAFLDPVDGLAAVGGVRVGRSPA